VWRDVYKDPITSRAKRSKKGRLAVVADGASYQTIRLDELAGRPNLLRPVFRNGQLLAQDDLLSIRQRVGW
jgi:nicotinamide phosphoribosyltransferase